RASRRSLPVLRSRHRGKPPLTPCIALSQTAHPLERLSFPTRRSSDLKQTGLPAFLSSVRIAWWSQRGLSLAGPTQAEARGHLKGDVATSHMTRGGHPWLIGTRAPAEEATAAIARAAGDAGFTELASATAMAPPRALSGIPSDTPVQLPKVT